MLHPAHALVLLVTIVVGVLTMNVSLSLLTLLGTEAVVVLLLPRLHCVKRWADRSALVKERAEAAAARLAALARMSDQHRRELEELERVAARLRLGIDGADRDDPRDDWMGLHQLTALYARLAIRHRAACEALKSPSGGVVEHEIARLEIARGATGTPLQESVERRLTVLRMRSQARVEARDELAAIELDLATIADVLRWMHELSATAGSLETRAELGVALASLREDGEMVRGLYRLEDGGLQPMSLALGRDASSLAEAVRLNVRVATGDPPPELAHGDVAMACDDPQIPAALRCETIALHRV